MLLNPSVQPRVGSRSAERVRLELMIDARAAHNRLRAEVIDCSTTGVRLRTLAPPRLGQSFWIKLPGLEALEAEAVWTEGFVCGCRFRAAIDPRVFSRMLDYARSAESAPHAGDTARLMPV